MKFTIPTAHDALADLFQLFRLALGVGCNAPKTQTLE